MVLTGGALASTALVATLKGRKREVSFWPEWHFVFEKLWPKYITRTPNTTTDVRARAKSRLIGGTRAWIRGEGIGDFGELRIENTTDTTVTQSIWCCMSS